ncbi:MAG: hypothetical protein HY738_14930 [Bacteroidia bacterium]|nr:hypothetical protein [Bacteroidia bacterium]
MKTLCAIIIFSITGIISVYGQSVSEFNLSDNVPKIVPPSQNAISLGKYGGFTSTSNFSGAANVSIPIYTLQGRYLSVPILLNYNTTGFKVDELSSWVGYGWALQTGGLITRVVYDKPDELHLSDNIPYRMFDVIQTMTPDLVDFVQNYESHDLQPDVFYFNFLNYSGKFFLSRKGSGTAILYASAIPYSNLEIKYIHSSNSFEVKDYSGTTYTFSETEMTKHDASPNKTFDDYAVTSWYLSTITHPAEESISFTYENIN